MLVLKKLGPDLFEEMVEVIDYLGKVEGMRVIVEPQEYEALVSLNLCIHHTRNAFMKATIRTHKGSIDQRMQKDNWKMHLEPDVSLKRQT